MGRAGPVGPSSHHRDRFEALAGGHTNGDPLLRLSPHTDLGFE